MTDRERTLLSEAEEMLCETLSFSSTNNEATAEGEIIRRIREGIASFDNEPIRGEAFKHLTRKALSNHLLNDPAGLFEAFPEYGSIIGEVLNELDAPSVEVTRFFESLPGQPGSAGAAGMMKKTLEPDSKYNVGDEVARGGMGAIRLGKDQTLMREVAIKSMLKLKPGVAENHSDMARFIEEAQVTGQLEHPGIVPVYELGVDDDSQVFYTMKFVKGKTLQSILNDIRKNDSATVAEFPLHRLVQLFYRVCDAVAFAHSRGVVHRDLKPANLMIGEFGEVFVMDWGLAKILGSSDDHEEADDSPALVESIRTTDEEHDWQTLAGQVGGTPEFMAPEQARGESHKIDPRSDIYALGAILYYILTLRPPISGTSVVEKLRAVDEGKILPPREFETDADLLHCPGGKIPDALAAVSMKAMSLSRADRYQSVKKLQGEIDAYERGFATGAEDAGLLTLIRLFMKRHQGAVAFLASIFVLLLGSSVILFHQRNAAVEARHRSDQLSAWLEADKVKSLIQSDKEIEAVPYLASQIRRNPRDQIAARRLLNILTFRDFALPRYQALTHQSRISCVRFSPKGDTVYTSSAAKYDSRLVAWDFNTGKMLRSMRHGEAIRWFDLSKKGDLAATPSMDGTTGIWNPNNGKKLIPALPTVEKARVFRCVLHPDGKFVAVTCGKSCRVWTLPDGKEISSLPKNLGHWVFDVAISPDGKRLAFGGLNCEVLVFDTETWKETHRISNDTGILSLQFSNDNNLLAIGDHAEAKVWNLKEDRIEGTPLRLNTRIRDVQFNTCGNLILFASENRQGVLWNFRTGVEPISRLNHLGKVSWSKFSPDESIIATGSSDQTVRLWDAATGASIKLPLRHAGMITNLRFHPSGKYLATASDDRSALIWDIRPGAARTTVRRDGEVLREARSQNGRVEKILNITASGKVYWRDPNRGMKIVHWWKPVPDRFFQSADLHPDGKIAAAADSKNRLYFWNLKPREKPELIHQFDEQIVSIRFSPKRNKLFILEAFPDKTTRSGFIHLLDVESRELEYSRSAKIARRRGFFDPAPNLWAPSGKAFFLSMAEQNHRLTKSASGPRWPIKD